MKDNKPDAVRKAVVKLIETHITELIQYDPFWVYSLRLVEVYVRYNPKKPRVRACKDFRTVLCTQTHSKNSSRMDISQNREKYW